MLKFDDDQYIKSVFQLQANKPSTSAIDTNEISNNLNSFYDSTKLIIIGIIQEVEQEFLKNENVKKRKYSAPAASFNFNSKNNVESVVKNLKYSPIEKIFNLDANLTNDIFRSFLEKSNNVNISPYLTKSMGSHIKTNNDRFKRVKELYKESMNKINTDKNPLLPGKPQKMLTPGIACSGNSIRSELREKLCRNTSSSNSNSLNTSDKKINFGAFNNSNNKSGTGKKTFGSKENSDNINKLSQISNFDFKSVPNLSNQGMLNVFNKKSDFINSNGLNNKPEEAVNTPSFLNNPVKNSFWENNNFGKEKTDNKNFDNNININPNIKGTNLNFDFLLGKNLSFNNNDNNNPGNPEDINNDNISNNSDIPLCLKNENSQKQGNEKQD